MELMQVEMFVAVVEEGSVQAAAERVFRTQPAVSMSLKKLEEEIGAALFDRSQRHDYLLTEAGEVLYSYATRLLNLRNEAVASLDSLKKLKQGHLRIGANESTNSYLLPELTHVFHERYPNIKIEVVCEHTDGLIRQLKERRLDLGLLAYLPVEHGLECDAHWCLRQWRGGERRRGLHRCGCQLAGSLTLTVGASVEFGTQQRLRSLVHPCGDAMLAPV